MIRVLRVIGVDIPRGWAVVDVGNVGASSGVALGEFEPGLEVASFADVVARHKAAAVAIETPIEPYIGGRGAKGNEGQRRAVVVSLMACARLGGRIEERASVIGLPCVVMDASESRRAFGIRGDDETGIDRSVKAMVEMHVRGWPKRSNSHNRDAAIAALVAGKRLMAKP